MVGKAKQLKFVGPLGHGGVRKGAGRPRQGDRARVSHAGREAFSKEHVVHVTCRLEMGLPSLRNARTVEVLMKHLARVCERAGFRVVEYSIQGNHIHLLCEATSSEALSAAMNGILSGMARVLNNHWGRRGRVFADRYHAELISTPTQCRNALLYVLTNAKKHGYLPLTAGTDPYSTAPWFPFDWYPSRRRDPKPAAQPRTWLLRTGWHTRSRAHLSLHDHPRIPSPARNLQPKQALRPSRRQNRKYKPRQLQE